MKRIGLLVSFFITAAIILACNEDEQHDGSAVELGSQTNFLKRCKTDNGCDDGLYCVSGVCTETCDADDECQSEQAKGKCVVADENQNAGACIAKARIESACMPECDSDEDCEPLRTCDRGVCVPKIGSPCLPTASCSPEGSTCAQDTPVGRFVFSENEIYVEKYGPSCPDVCMVDRVEGDISPECVGENCASLEDVENGIYCSCRCDLPENETGEPCTCPEGMSCSSEMFEAASGGLRGGYCIKDGT